MRAFPMFVVASFSITACSSDQPTAPRPTAPASAARSASAAEGTEAREAAHLDLREVRAELLAVDRAYADAAKSVNLIDALVAPLAPQAVFLAPGPVFPRGPAAVRALLEATPQQRALEVGLDPERS